MVCAIKKEYKEQGKGRGGGSDQVSRVEALLRMCEFEFGRV